MNGTYELSFHTQELYEALAFDKMDLKHILRIVESKLRQAGKLEKSARWKSLMIMSRYEVT